MMSSSQAITNESAALMPLDGTIEGFRTLSRHFANRFVAIMTKLRQRCRTAMAHASYLVRQVCAIAGNPDLIDDARAECKDYGLTDAVQAHDDGPIFDWLMEVISYQGVADAVASAYLKQHGSITASDIEQGLIAKPSCPKLSSYWHFQGCGYRKAQAHCNEPSHYSACPLPSAQLRNGNLNQAGYSLYLFMRDVSGGDFVGWLDHRLETADRPRATDRVRRLCNAVLEPLAHVHGISYKVLSMSLAHLLLGADPSRERWRVAGTGMIAVDTLVHNWFHRTGILKVFKAAHPYGARCYGEQGCAAIVDRLAKQVDARAFDPDFPKTFPRFVQLAIWAFCAQRGLDQCNGNRINDKTRCRQVDCHLYARCDRLVLNQMKPEAPAS